MPQYKINYRSHRNAVEHVEASSSEEALKNFYEYACMSLALDPDDITIVGVIGPPPELEKELEHLKTELTNWRDDIEFREPTASWAKGVTVHRKDETLVLEAHIHLNVEDPDPAENSVTERSAVLYLSGPGIFQMMEIMEHCRGDNREPDLLGESVVIPLSNPHLVEHLIESVAQLMDCQDMMVTGMKTFLSAIYEPESVPIAMGAMHKHLWRR